MHIWTYCVASFPASNVNSAMAIPLPPAGHAVIVEGIPAEIASEEIRAIFGCFGDVLSVTRGGALTRVAFATEQEASDALAMSGHVDPAGSVWHVKQLSALPPAAATVLPSSSTATTYKSCFYVEISYHGVSS